MPSKQHLSGCDNLMLGFDYEMRRHGYAGNSCQVVLELASAVSPDALRRRLAELVNRHPILGARPSKIILPKWNFPRAGAPMPQVRVHQDRPGLREALCNEPISPRRGELLRFDLIERDAGRMDIVFTWAHALMDANSAEHFLAVVGREDVPLPATDPIWPKRVKKSLKERIMLARNNICQLDEFCKAPPRTVGVRHQNAPSALRYRVEKFSAEETAQVRAHAVKHGGMFGEAQYHASVSVIALHHLHQRIGWSSPSYVLPIPVGMRPKGNVEPLFTNLVTMLMLQFLPEHLDSIGHAVSTLKKQTEQAMRAGLVDSGVLLLETVRFMPRPILMAFLKHGLRGEICSLFYGNTAAVSPLVTTFLGATVEDFAHVAAVTPSPGIGVIFYYFRGQLRVTVLHLPKSFTDEEAAGYAAGLRARLLNP
ncbi:MAG TPA: hypothetical protein VNT99_17165 [Methylomirabilota bacterium]|nr:hypothetical protein [Methylomirabilota bacterium]